jgi:hypothetical protein
VPGERYDYRVTIERRDGTTSSFAFRSSETIEEGQVLDMGSQRCGVSSVSPDPQITPGQAQMIFVHCYAVED